MGDTVPCKTIVLRTFLMKIQTFTVLVMLLTVYQVFNSDAVYAKSTSTEEFYILATINGTGITNYDIITWRRLFSLLSPDYKQSDSDILEEMISVEIKKQQIEYYGINISDEAINSAYESFARFYSLSPDQLTHILEKNDIPPEILLQHVQTQTAWQQFVISMYPSSYTITNSAVEQEKSLRADMSIPISYKLYEITPVAVGSQNAIEMYKTLRNAISLTSRPVEEMLHGYVLAENIHVSDLGWIAENQLPREIVKILENLEKNDISEPVSIPNSNKEVMFLLQNKRDAVKLYSHTYSVAHTVMTASNTNSPTVRNIQFHRAKNFAQNISNCDDLKLSANDNDDIDIKNITSLRPADMDNWLKDEVLHLQEGQTTPPLIGNGIFHFFTVCEIAKSEITVEDLRKIIRKSQLESLSKKLLSSALRSATIVRAANKYN